jgi:hypothetical protein
MAGTRRSTLSLVLRHALGVKQRPSIALQAAEEYARKQLNNLVSPIYKDISIAAIPLNGKQKKPDGD